MIGEKNDPRVRIKIVDAREGLEAPDAGQDDAEQDDVGEGWLAAKNDSPSGKHWTEKPSRRRWDSIFPLSRGSL
jgi:hypothetical protein